MTAFTGCSIDRDEQKRTFVLSNHLAGVSPNRMETLSRQTPGMTPMKAETIGKHIRVCLPRGFKPDQRVSQRPPGLPPSQAGGEAIAISRAARTDHHIARVVTTAPRDDVALEVQRQVMEKLKTGEARVTVQHGLQAQQMLDRREERAKDRALAITLTRMLHQPVAPAEIIDVTPVGERDLEDDLISAVAGNAE